MGVNVQKNTIFCPPILWVLDIDLKVIQCQKFALGDSFMLDALIAAFFWQGGCHFTRIGRTSADSNLGNCSWDILASLYRIRCYVQEDDRQWMQCSSVLVVMDSRCIQDRN